MESTLTAAGLTAFWTQIVAPLLLCSSIPLGSPPVQDPALGRAAPEQCLLYIGWAGIGIPDPKSPNRAERFLADPEVRHMREEAARRFRALCKANPKEIASELIGPFAPVPDSVGSDIAKWSELFATQPCAFFLSCRPPGGKSTLVPGALVLNMGDAKDDVAAMLRRYEMAAAGEIIAASKDGNVEYRIKKEGEERIRWALCGKYFILVAGGESPAEVVNRMRGSEPPWFAAIAKDLPVQRRAAVLRFDLQGLLKAMNDPDFNAGAKRLGLDHVRAVTLVTGLDREDFVGRLLVEADPATAIQWQQGVARPVKLDDLGVVPSDATLAAAVNVKPTKLIAWMKCLQATIAKADHDDPTAAQAHNSANGWIQSFQRAAGGDYSNFADALHASFPVPRGELDEAICPELEASLGETWRIYASPAEGSLAFVNITGVVRVKDRQRLSIAFDKLAACSAAKASERKKNYTAAKEPVADDWTVAKTRFVEHDVYCLHRHNDAGHGLLAWTIANDELVCSPSPQNVKAYLLRDTAAPSLASAGAMRDVLSARQPAIVFYEDSQAMCRVAYPLAQACVNYGSASAGLHTGGPDPMLLPAAPTVAKYLRPAVSTFSLTPKGAEFTVHQSLPNGNLGMLLYMSLCSSLPEDVNAWTPPAQTSAAPQKPEEPAPPIVFRTVSDKEGRCTIKKRRDEAPSASLVPPAPTPPPLQPSASSPKLAPETDEFIVEVGRNLHVKCKFYSRAIGGNLAINGDMTVKNTSKQHRACQYYIAFFDKGEKLVACMMGRNDDVSPTGDQEQWFGWNLCAASEEQIKAITSYKLRLYESDRLPEPKK